MRIPAKANSIPEGSRTGFRAGPEQQSERSDASWVMARRTKRLPQGVCLQRRETAHADVRAFIEALEKGLAPKVG
jgi:hypothetical protein